MQGYTPAWLITANGSDLTKQLKNRLLSLTVNDEVGVNSDTVEIRIDDRDGLVAIPPYGADLWVSMGYLESGLVDKGHYRVDEIECEGPERSILIRARSADTNTTNALPHIKAGNFKTWRDPQTGNLMNIKTIAGLIAGQESLGATVDKDLGELFPVSDQQAGMSNIDYLGREVRDKGGQLKVANGQILIFKQASGKSAGSGVAMPSIAVIPSDCMRWRWLGTRRSSHNQVTARWTDAAGTGHDVVVGGGASGETSNTMLAEDFDNGDDALGAATAKLNALSISQDSVSLSMVGNPKIACEVRLILSGFKPRCRWHLGCRPGSASHRR